MGVRTMERNDAIARIAAEDLTQLNVEDRENLLIDWWTIDEMDPEFALLPQALRSMVSQEYVPGDAANPIYNSLLELAIRHTYLGVLNSYLQQRLLKVGVDVNVVGQVEDLNKCPCCGYRVHESQGDFEVCPVCYWEDDGTANDKRYSSANHMTLEEARSNFERIGAAHDGLKDKVLKDGKLRYSK